MEKKPDSGTYKEIKRVGILANRRLKKAHKNFCTFFSKNYQQERPSVKSVKIDEIRLDTGKISRHPKIS